MKPMNDRTQLGRPRPTPRKPFRIEKIEERIAPRIFGHYNPHTKCVGGQAGCD